jgi:hypothetical protein
VAKRKAAAGQPAPSRKEKPSAGRDFSAEYQRRKHGNGNGRSARPKVKPASLRPTAEIPAAAAGKEESGFSFCCMRCGFRHELTAEGLRALQEGN